MNINYIHTHTHVHCHTHEAMQADMEHTHIQTCIQKVDLMGSFHPACALGSSFIWNSMHIRGCRQGLKEPAWSLSRSTAAGSRMAAAL